MNSAFVFVKPHAASNEKVRELVRKQLTAAGCNVTSTGEILAETIDKDNLVDVHYYAIASKAVLLQPKELPVPADKFQEKFGISWDSALEKGLCYNAQDAGKKFGLNAGELEKKWGDTKKAGKMIKFGGGFYCAEMDGCYVFNGFFMSMRDKYVKPGTMIYYMKIEFDPKTLTWADFRLKVIGTTDPSVASKESIRGALFADWKSLGLTSELDNGDNGVHGSASPFEGLAEKMNWCGDELKSDPFGKALLDSGLSAETVNAWTKDPQVVIEEGGKKGSLFDAVEDMDYEDCLAALVKLNKLNALSKTSDDVKQVEDAKEVDDTKEALPPKEAEPAKEADKAENADAENVTDDKKEVEPVKADDAQKGDSAKEADSANKVETADAEKGTNDTNEAEPAKEADKAEKADAETGTDDKKEVEPANEVEDGKKAEDAEKADTVQASNRACLIL